MLRSISQYLSKNNLKNLFQKQVIRNLITVGFITLILKGIGFLKESVVASNYGLSELLDTFFIAYLIPGFIMNVFIGAFKSVFIPNYIAELKTGNNISSFQGTGFLVTGAISVLFMVFAFLFTDVYLENFFPGHAPEYYKLIKAHFYYVMPCIILWGFSSLLEGLLNINNEFKLSSFGGIFIPLTIIASVLYFQDFFGEMALALGTLLGSMAGLAYLLFVCLRKRILNISKPDFNNANARLMFAQIPAKVSSGFLTGMNGVVDQYFAAQLAIGSIAAINYGGKMPTFFKGLLVVAITNVLLPYFSKMILENRERTFALLFKIIKRIMLVAGVLAIAGIFLTDFFVELIFQRKEFTPEDTRVVADIQKIFLVYIPFAICGMVIVNFLTSINKNAFMAYVSLGAVILNIILDYILIKYYGILGIAICTTVVIILKNIVLFIYAYKLSRRTT